MKRFLSELRRREVVKSLVAYVGISWLILQVVGVVAGMIEMNPMVGPGTLLVLACGLPIVLYISWHFDVSLEGIERTPDLDEEENPTIQPLGWLRWIGLIFIVFVSTFIGWQYFNSIKLDQIASEEGLTTIQLADSIAVLPFSDQSEEQDQSYLALGLAEEITSLLGRSDGFKVSASRSSQILAKQGMPPTDIGRRLNVKTVLTGSVRVTGNRLRVRVELLDTENGHTLWTESFLRELKDIFQIENEISRAVVNLLQDKYYEAGSFAKLSSTSTDAYVMYLKGREQYRLQTTESMKQARTFFEQALALDPEFAKAYVGLADTLALLAEGGERFGVIKTEIAAKLAQGNIDKALVRNSELAEAYAVKGYIASMQNDLDTALQDYNKAILLNPSLAIAYMWKFLALDSLGRFDESLIALEKSLALDPLFQTAIYNMGVTLTKLGRFSEAEATFMQLQKDFPQSQFSYQGLSDIYFSQGNLFGAIQQTQKALALSPENQDLAFKLVGLLLTLGSTDVVKELNQDPQWAEIVAYFEDNILIFEQEYAVFFDKMDFKLAANPDDYWLSFEAAWYQAMFGDKEKAVKLFIDKLSLVEQADMFAMPYCSSAIEVAWAHIQRSETQQAQELIGTCKKLMEEQLKAAIIYSEIYYLEARIHALEARPEEAVASLELALEKGWREWWTKYDPLLSSLAENPDYQLLLTTIEEDLAEQRQQVKALFQK